MLETIVKSKVETEPLPVQTNTEETNDLKGLQEMSKRELISLLNTKMLENQTKEIKNDVNLQLVIKQKSLSDEMQHHNFYDIYRIVITGGPCAGKTTTITTIADKLRELGYATFVVPEAASLILGTGTNISLVNYSEESLIQFQYYLMMLQITMEDIFKGISTVDQKNQNIVLLSDRGTMDGSAYVEKHIWNRILSEHDLNEHKLRDSRYDLVIHLSTAANGAEKFYIK